MVIEVYKLKIILFKYPNYLLWKLGFYYFLIIIYYSCYIKIY